MRPTTLRFACVHMRTHRPAWPVAAAALSTHGQRVDGSHAHVLLVKGKPCTHSGDVSDPAVMPSHHSPAAPPRSYPFFDPVLTDRAFLNEPRTMVKSFTLGGTVAGIFILLFGFFGMFGNMQAILRPDACAP